MAYVSKYAATTVAHLPGVRLAVYAAALEIGIKAESKLMTHRDTGASKVEVTRGKTDSYVSLVDEEALAIEFGHFRRTAEGFPIFVPGLYIVTGAAGIIK